MQETSPGPKSDAGKPKTALDEATLQAYRDTDYRVHSEQAFSLRIDEYSADLAALHKRHRVDCSAFLTACNPFSQLQDAAGNAERQSALLRELRSRSLVFVQGMGQHHSNGWPGEESVLILGLAQEAAKALGTRYDQNAIVWCGADAVPRLLMLR